MREPLYPAPYADVNEALRDLLARMQTILAGHFVGMYLSGSLALGDFDPRTSDIDFVVVTDAVLSDDLFSALQDMHARFDESRSPWAAKVEAVYIPRDAFRHLAPTNATYPQIEKGRTVLTNLDI